MNEDDTVRALRTTEDDTFRVLTRKSLAELVHDRTGLPTGLIQEVMTTGGTLVTRLLLHNTMAQATEKGTHWHNHFEENGWLWHEVQAELKRLRNEHIEAQDD